MLRLFSCSLLCAGCTISRAEPLPAELDGGSTLHDAGKQVHEAGRQVHEAGSQVHEAGSSDSEYVLPDGAVYEPSKLPACTWPADILPPVPDGGIGAGFVVRSWTYSTGCLPRYRMELGCVAGPGSDCADPSAYTPGGFGACVEACTPDEYVIGTPNWFGSTSGNLYGPPPDADVVYPHFPSGCHAPPSSFLNVYLDIATAEPYPTVTCCPCE